MNKIPTYNFHNLGREEKLVDLFIWTEPDPYKVDYPHYHDYHEIMIFYKGAGNHEIDFKTYTMADTSFHIIPRNFIHKLNCDKPSSGFTIALSQVFVDQLCQFDPTTNYYSLFEQEQVIQFSKVEFSYFRFYLDEINKPTISDAFRQNICSAIMLKLFPYVDNKLGFSSFTQTIRKAVTENFEKRLSTSEYAEILKVSPYHLNENLKSATNKTVIQLQDDMLISKVKRLLYSSDSSLKEIAFGNGFNDYAHFSKFFKNHCGYSPLQYRKLLKNVQEFDTN